MTSEGGNPILIEEYRLPLGVAVPEGATVDEVGRRCDDPLDIVVEPGWNSDDRGVSRFWVFSLVDRAPVVAYCSEDWLVAGGGDAWDQDRYQKSEINYRKYETHSISTHSHLVILCTTEISITI